MITQERYVPEPNSGCWLWMGAQRNGYGTISRRNAPNLYAHRVSYEQHIGEIPDGDVVCHVCDTPLCVNPDHLFLGSHADNVKDKMLKGRAAKKLSPARVAEIRSAQGSLREIAKQFEVSHTMVHYIRTNQSWKWSK